MAEYDWRPSYNINFVPNGDLTMEAIYKHIQEILKIYGHLNYLRANTEGGASLAIGGFAPTPDDLPTEGVPVNSVYLTNGDQYNLYVWNGERWNKLNTNAIPIGTTEVPGVVQLGTLAGVGSDVPSPNKVVTEEVLANYRDAGGTAGVPSGTVIMWWGSPFAIPPGWLYCDGTAGTPDLRDRFVKCTPNVNKEGGDKGGASTYAILEENMPVHNHTFAGSGSARIQVGNHSHTFSASVTGGGGAVSGYTGSGQAHQHSLNGSGYNTVMVYGTPRSVSVVMDPFATNQATVLNTADGVTTTSLTTSESSHTHSFSGSGGGGGSVSGSTNSTGGFDQSATVSVSGNTGNKGGNVAVDNKPPFCEMIFLMKL